MIESKLGEARNIDAIDGRYWNRTSDSYRVKVVLYL